MVTKNSKTKGRKSGRQTQAANKKKGTNVRLSKEQAEKRYDEAREYFRKNPEAAGTAFNDLLKSRGEPMMNIAKVYALRSEARKGVGKVAPAQSTGTNGAETVPVIPAVEFENARAVMATGARARGGTVLPFDRVRSEASKLWDIMKVTGVSAVTIADGKVHLSGKYQVTEAL